MFSYVKVSTLPRTSSLVLRPPVVEVSPPSCSLRFRRLVGALNPPSVEHSCLVECFPLHENHEHWTQELKKIGWKTTWGVSSVVLTGEQATRTSWPSPPETFCNLQEGARFSWKPVSLPTCDWIAAWALAEVCHRSAFAGTIVRLTRLYHHSRFLDLLEGLRALDVPLVLPETKKDAFGLWSHVEIQPRRLRALNLDQALPWWTNLRASPYLEPFLSVLARIPGDHVFPADPELLARLKTIFGQEEAAVRMSGNALHLRITGVPWKEKSSFEHVHEGPWREQLESFLEDLENAARAPLQRRDTGNYLVAIDGPAGAGKSTVSKLLARRLRYQLIDTGAMFRSVAFVAIRDKVSFNDVCAMESIADRLVFEFRLVDGDNQVWVSERGRPFEDWSECIRRSDAGSGASLVGLILSVRRILLQKQREIGRTGKVVMEGRDIGSVVFPDAEMKFFLTASVQARAQRRWRELVTRGESVRLDSVEEEIRLRDEQDSTREVAPMVIPVGAEVIDASELSLLETVDVLERRVLKLTK